MASQDAFGPSDIASLLETSAFKNPGLQQGHFIVEGLQRGNNIKLHNIIIENCWVGVNKKFLLMPRSLEMLAIK